MKILTLNGINLNMFGKRDAATYGTATLTQINDELIALGNSLGVTVENFQTNHEGEMCEKIHQAYFDNVDAVLINAGGLDALQLRNPRRVGDTDMPNY